MQDLPNVVLSLETYEERVALHAARLELKQQQTLKKMRELGFTQAEIESLKI